MYGIMDSKNNIFTEDYEELSSGYIEQVSQFLQQNPRFPTKLVKNGATMKEMYKLFSKIMPNATKNGFEYKEIEYFTNAASVMKVIKVKSRLIDMFLFVLIAAYLLGIYTYMRVIIIGYKN